VDLPYVSMFVSSTNPIAIVGPASKVGKRVEAKNKNRIRDRLSSRLEA